MRELLFLKCFTVEMFVGYDYTYIGAKPPMAFKREIDGFTLRLRSFVVTVSKAGS